MANYEIIYNNDGSSRKSLPSTDFTLSDSAFIQNVSGAFEIRLAPELIAKEIAFFLICLGVLMYVGNAGTITPNKGLDSIALYASIFTGSYQLFKASFVSMIPGLLCISTAVFLKYFGANISYFQFIDHEAIGYILCAGLSILPLSFFRSF